MRPCEVDTGSFKMEFSSDEEMSDDGRPGVLPGALKEWALGGGGGGCGRDCSDDEDDHVYGKKGGLGFGAPGKKGPGGFGGPAPGKKGPAPGKKGAPFSNGKFGCWDDNEDESSGDDGTFGWSAFQKQNGTQPGVMNQLRGFDDAPAEVNREGVVGNKQEMYSNLGGWGEVDDPTPTADSKSPVVTAWGSLRDNIGLNSWNDDEEDEKDNNYNGHSSFETANKGKKGPVPGKKGPSSGGLLRPAVHLGAWGEESTYHPSSSSKDNVNQCDNKGGKKYGGRGPLGGPLGGRGASGGPSVLWNNHNKNQGGPSAGWGAPGDSSDEDTHDFYGGYGGSPGKKGPPSEKKGPPGGKKGPSSYDKGPSSYDKGPSSYDKGRSGAQLGGWGAPCPDHEDESGHVGWALSPPGKKGPPSSGKKGPSAWNLPQRYYNEAEHGAIANSTSSGSDDCQQASAWSVAEAAENKMSVEAASPTSNDLGHSMGA